MRHKTISLVTALLFVCSGLVGFQEMNAEAGVFSRSVARVAARKAARRSAGIAARRAAARKAVGKTIQKKPAPKKNWKAIFARERARDNKTVAKPLKQDRVVRRYTSIKNARAAKANGIPANTHMTARVPKGRPISATTAKKRYGLKTKPDARLTIKIPKGHPVKKNKAMANQSGGWGEITSPKRIPTENVVRMDKIH